MTKNTNLKKYGLLGKNINYSFSKRRAGDVASAYADVSKANKELGWKSKLSLKDGLISAWKWHKNNKL